MLASQPFPGRRFRVARRLFIACGFLAAAVFSSTVFAQVVVNEVMQNPSAVSDGSGEWFELFNNSGAGIDIDGWTVQDNDTDSFVINNGGPLVIAAGGYLVLGNNADSGTNGGVTVDYQYSGMFLGNSGDELVLLDGASAEVDRVEWDNGATFPDPNGASMSLISPALNNNDGTNWCEASTPFGAGDLGTPGAANDCAPAIPELVINEIMQNPSAVSDGSGEWFEIFNAGGAAVDIEGWTVSDNGSDSFVIASGGPLLVPAGGFVVLGNNGDFATNGGVIVDYQYSGMFLANGDDELVLTDTLANEIDRVEWDGGPVFPDPAGASMSLEATDLDNNDGTNWCEAQTPFGAGDLGTPGAANDCPMDPVDVPAIVINEIMQNPSAVSDGSGEWFELFNATGADVDINGWTVKDNDSDSFVISNGGPLLVPAGGFAVLSNNGDSATNGGVIVDFQYSGMFLSNSSDELVLLDGSLNEVDRVEWDNGATFPDPSGAAMALISPALDNNIGANWCESASPFGAGDDGTPGAVNDCGVQLVVNEIDYDQPSADTAEFVEIKNRGTEAADLANFELVLVNGNGGTPYDTIPLPAATLQPGEYFVVCASAATVANCDLEALNSIQNGAPDAVAISQSGVIVDSVTYEGDIAVPFTEGSGAGLQDSGSSGQDFRSIGRFPDGIDTNRNNVDLVNACITPGTGNTSLSSGCTANGPVLEIFEIQGSGSASAFVGQSLGSNDNIVTALAPDGFFIQTPAARSDGDVNTSDGIFVFTDAPPTVAVGDQVDVAGTIVEFFDFTEIGGAVSVSVDSSGNALPPAVVFDGATPSPDPLAPSCSIEFECYEGMLIDIPVGTVSAPNQSFGSDPVAEIHIVAGNSRSFREPGIEFPGIAGLLEWDGNPEVFELDPDKLGLPNAEVPAGSSFSASGVLGFEFGGYELWPTSFDFSPAPIPVAVRDRGVVEMTVGSLNMLRLFDDIDDGTGPVTDPVEYAARLGKFSLYIRDVLDAPDILAVQEVENLNTLQDLANQIALDDPAVVYTPHLVEGNDVGGIDVGFLTRDTIAVDAVSQLGAAEILSVDGSLLHDRPPLLLEGRCTANGSNFPIQVMVVHNRSLNGIDDPSSGPRVRQKRLEQAQSIAQKVQDIQVADPGVNLVVVGDFNAYQFTDGYVDVVGQIKGEVNAMDNLLSGPDVVNPNLINQVDLLPAEQQYSFIFRGNAQALDHALTSSALDSLVADFQFGRGNVDAAEILFDDPSTPLAASDHDGFVLFLVKDSDGDSITDNVDLCPNTAVPENVPTVRLGRNRYALVDGDAVFDTNRGKATFTLTDTAGCSCEQIIDIEELGNGQRRFGCSRGAIEDFIEDVVGGGDDDDDDDGDDDDNGGGGGDSDD